ncbi:MAG: hypothetical protein JJ908_04845 [Rhizobiales bacterium]|jgi:hypothetical protein|nr:hypothetical protein [Hyphomicrobiales bacterium]MBO6698070.1 hypothetical protein [Hyphomicrobiales bacterium]MBO6735676.1 hypothetical protein [Hyphomicrobiales bacterium]MBO6910516.1 hypothetical protein [Hyphomicrobiales bacterium]MBO6956133.1 hypothetical protein [Hyphomicrobiales bacterium]
MPMIKAITSSVERAIANYNQKRIRAEEERLTELQFAREMRVRAEPGSPDFYYYNAIVKRCGGI